MESPQGQALRCIVKMGGAAITHKDEFESINVEKLSTTCRQLSQSMNASCNTPINMDWSRGDGAPLVPEVLELQGNSICTERFIIIHGAGSFGHFQASKSSVHKGGLETAIGKAGFVATRISVTKLNQEIVRALASEGIPAVGISPFSAGWSTRSRALEQYEVSMLRKSLDCGLIPVLHGDAVFDSAQGCTILSGDVVLRKLAQDLKPLHTVFLTDVPGVFDRPPSDKDAILLEEIVVHIDGSWKITRPVILSAKTGVETVTAAHDTTGGMAAKIAEAAIIAVSGVDVYIVEVGTQHALEAFNCTSRHSLSKEWVGTIVRASS
ncbi:hypothetical protein GOP47_0019521 [Adiantum capillus-veneris]|uniref:Isopentenyl phosphate kinase n=1 Tax=Adiantum capillus-veneris TaxID=13818 RepID=A0A9D4Z9P7_ADICA|nr:hypothetical protein GOP47_0019521 [Adiantum capillus-veneris]